MKYNPFLMPNSLQTFSEFILQNFPETKINSENGIIYFNTSKTVFLFIPVNYYEHFNNLPIFDYDNIIWIWEDIWETKQDKVKNRINYLLGNTQRIFARNTFVKKITQTQAIQFHEENHLNGSTKSDIKLGLFYKNELVAVATFSKGLLMKYEEKPYVSHNLIRFCTKMGINVVGGLSKFLHHFIKIEKAVHIMTSIDLEWSKGEGFAKIGFKATEKTAMHYFYTHKTTLKRYYPHQLTTINESDYYKVSNLGNVKMILDLRTENEK